MGNCHREENDVKYPDYILVSIVPTLVPEIGGKIDQMLCERQSIK